MDISIRVLYDTVERFRRPLLDNDSEYCSVYEKTEMAQHALLDAHSEETVHAFLDLINEYQHLDYLREHYFLLVGLQMGLELGNNSTLLFD